MIRSATLEAQMLTIGHIYTGNKYMGARTKRPHIAVVSDVSVKSTKRGTNTSVTHICNTSQTLV